MPKKPAPFKRPSIEISNTGPKRSWQWVSPEVLDAGDTLADFGVVSKVVVRHRPQSHATIILEDGYESGVQPVDSIEVFGKLGAHTYFQPSDVVHAFTATKG